ncbi:hypothetical protein GCM10007301_27590 [Azorhizobium oxalatiphilum]|uniref:Uncharacterized protein n=1 Tax=Azorhizobium oxalatiphilum TaxID=980631 RepID=A0A917C0G8_9HYPH|nr:hypothetical protein GCM10007301_27590 [Azorhizobium oxalatiphilum]
MGGELGTVAHGAHARQGLIGGFADERHLPALMGEGGCQMHELSGSATMNEDDAHSILQMSRMLGIWGIMRGPPMTGRARAQAAVP